MVTQLVLLKGMEASSIETGHGERKVNLKDTKKKEKP
jgi:hypothetical protein